MDVAAAVAMAMAERLLVAVLAERLWGMAGKEEVGVLVAASSTGLMTLEVAGLKRLGQQESQHKAAEDASKCCSCQPCRSSLAKDLSFFKQFREFLGYCRKLLGFTSKGKTIIEKIGVFL